MKLFRKLFAEKILRYYEGTEAGIKMIKSFPVIRKLVKDDAFGEKSKKGLVFLFEKWYVVSNKSETWIHLLF